MAMRFGDCHERSPAATFCILPDLRDFHWYVITLILQRFHEGLMSPLRLSLGSYVTCLHCIHGVIMQGVSRVPTHSHFHAFIHLHSHLHFYLRPHPYLPC